MTKKIYVVLTLCLLFIGLPISATAQKATVIKGIVRDSITHEPISYASVFFVGSDKGLMTDDDGKFRYVIIFSMFDFLRWVIERKRFL